MLRAILNAIFGRRGPTSEATVSEREAQAAIVRAILDLRAIVKSEDANQIKAGIANFRAQVEGRLEPRELASEIANADFMLAFISIKERLVLERGEALTAIASMPDGGPCYFSAKHIWLERRRDDDVGQLDITDKGIFYDGSTRLTLPWSKVLTLSLSDHSLVVHRTSGGNPHSFQCHGMGEAKLAHLAALTIWKQANTEQSRPTKTGRPKKSTSALGTAAASPVGTTIELPGAGGSFSLGIVGESHRQAVLRALGGDRRARGEVVVFGAVFVPDPNNAHDPNAVAVYIQGGSLVGYLSRDDALAYQEIGRLLIQRKAVGLCRAKLIGGTPGKPSLGVVLDLPDPQAILAVLADDQPF